MDIKQRLRQQAESFNKDTGFTEDTGRLCVDALAEIERLEKTEQAYGELKESIQEYAGQVANAIDDLVADVGSCDEMRSAAG